MARDFLALIYFPWECVKSSRRRARVVRASRSGGRRAALVDSKGMRVAARAQIALVRDRQRISHVECHDSTRRAHRGVGRTRARAEGEDATSARTRVRASGDVDDASASPIVDASPTQFLVNSLAFYAVMTVSAQVVCDFADIHPDVIDSARAFDVDQATMWMLPLLASLAFAVTQSEKYEFLRSVRKTFEEGVLPVVAPLGVAGIGLLSVGAGVGEEALFRGFLMPMVSERLGDVGASADVAAACALASTSLAFGALHAITPQYAIWATWASVLFSLESIRDGLGSAMFTHAFYDFLAFLYIIVSWMPTARDER